MSNILNSEDFGLKIYNRFPPKYREDDVGQNFALKRYLQSLSDGGFKYSIDEINGIADLIDPDKVDLKVLPVLFKQYGLEIFNGIPEEYLRYLLPRLGEAWSRKGSLSVIEYVSSFISGIKTSTEVVYDENNDITLNVRLEMDYTLSDYFPEPEQFERLLSNFVPFYVDMVLLYSYVFHESQVLRSKDEDCQIFKVRNESEDSGSFRLKLKLPDSAVFGEAVFGKAVFGVSCEVDRIEDLIIYKSEEAGTLTSIQTGNSILNKESCALNDNFVTNGLVEYDIITVGNRTEIIIS